MQLQRKAGTDGTWENVGEPVTITVNKNQDQDSYTWNDLLQYTEETDRKNYSYRVVELNASGNEIVEGGKNGEYAVSYGNANGISQSGTVQINNTWVRLMCNSTNCCEKRYIIWPLYADNKFYIMILRGQWRS